MAGRGRRALLWAAATVVAVIGLASTAAAASGDIGFEGASYAPLGGSPTGSKPESKLWFNDGRWWASMFDAAAGANRIFRLDRGSQRWTSTGVALDDRDTSRADVLWDPLAGKLYVASHLFVTTGGAASPLAAGRLYRYSYDTTSDRYTLDAGFPVTVNGARTETLVIDKDSTGTLWATWTQDRRVYVSHTVGGNDAVWGTPYIVPGPGTSLDNDDISSLVHFGGQIGVMWSNQANDSVYFARHRDGAGDSAASWTTEVVPTGASADDHINLKADRSGRVYAAVKTSEDAPLAPLALLLVRPVSGAWSATTFGLVADSHTRPIVELDEQHGVLHMFATCPQPPSSSGQSGGDICHKTASMASPEFAPGIGSTVIRDASSEVMNDASSTKQSLDAGSGLVVLANNSATRVYWHADLSLGGDRPPTLTASFGVDTQSGLTPLDVRFTDTSSGNPTGWSWSFGDGTGSSSASPTHRYLAVGTYTVTLTVATATQSDTHSTTVTVGAPSGAPAPLAGAQVVGTALPRVTLRAARLRGQRVRLYGSATPIRSALRVSLLRRDRRGRWLFVRRAPLRLRPNAIGRFGFVVRRATRRTAYRVVITIPGSGRRSSRMLVVARRG